jgi:hypothetical protein
VTAAHLFGRLFDDAAMFPPGNAPIEVAVAAHQRTRHSAVAGYVGPLIAPLSLAADVAALWPSDGAPPVEVALTCTADPVELGGRLQAALDLPHLRVAAVEAAVPHDMSAVAAVEMLGAIVPDRVRVFVEVPRDARRRELLKLLVGSRLRAKFRVGGMTADAHPSEAELADAIHLSVSHGVPFKATAGLHHAVRNTDTATGFGQHGFLNLMAAVAAAAAGVDIAGVEEILRCRDASAVSGFIASLSDKQATGLRDMFLSVGTCSISEPLGDLTRLQLVPAVFAHQGLG